MTCSFSLLSILGSLDGQDPGRHRCSRFSPGTSQMTRTSLSLVRTSMSGTNAREFVAVPSADPMTSSNMRSSAETASHAFINRINLLDVAPLLSVRRISLGGDDLALSREGDATVLEG